MKVVTKDTWKYADFPSHYDIIKLNRQISLTHYQLLSCGLRPRNMDDRWFVYSEDNWVYFHRSWTGFCIYKLHIEQNSEQCMLTDLLVNRVTDQYNSTDLTEDIRLFNWLLDYVITMNSKAINNK